ncbi:MAG: metal ABC transporter substrate-binding protein, partial [Comamonas sp.]
DKQKPWVPALIKSYQSEEVRQFIDKEFKGSVFPAF